MREIKFRAWIKKEKRMDDVDFINFAAQFAGKWECKKPDADLFSDRGDEVATRRGRLFNLEDVSIMQFTGLKDKNGREIYEGDVVKHFDEILVVVWIDDKCRFYALSEYGLKHILLVGAELSKESVKNMKIIGNIFENSELLEQAK
jgi:uncharacterized phage protein (TIGR01671 family)